ncbi:hypothetical protein [Thermocatellispora tengchongensis]|uniref:hypothetical protein n=1 Tax=Thermocatellispora tengchongensis TaxID=1073253 RepID=UPI001C858764|nr:hypothetical protein [Thermocatellispora tengchongensis]
MPGAVVSLMGRTNVETVIVARKVRKWRGRLLDSDLSRLRRELEASRARPRRRLRIRAGAAEQALRLLDVMDPAVMNGTDLETRSPPAYA